METCVINTHKRCTYVRLNRTMQYGNRGKHRHVLLLGWCLNRTMQYGNLKTIVVFFPFYLFKSYYVVWKHNLTVVEDCINSLNRTMQYGNPVIIVTKKFRKKSLNRTMQYGNSHIRCNSKAVSASLNRTMQYGN